MTFIQIWVFEARLDDTSMGYGINLESKFNAPESNLYNLVLTH